jgi:hypothetical protein
VFKLCERGRSAKSRAKRHVNAAGLLASLNMLIMTAGGFDFTGADCIAWMLDVGFRDMRVDPLTSDQSMLVGRK